VGNLVLILLVIATVKFVVFGWILYVVFKPDIQQLAEENRESAPVSPTCVYCQSRWTRAIDEGQARWDDGVLVLVTTYQCQHCETPFWHVDRVPMSKISA
jgi:hypothetical protein